MSFWKWSRTAVDNTSIGSIDLGEGTMEPRAVNNALREHMAKAKDFVLDLTGNQAAVTSGTSTAYTLTTRSTLAVLEDGAILGIIPHADNGSSPTFSPDGLAAAPIYIKDGTAPAAGQMQQNRLALLTYKSSFNSGSGAWLLANPAPSSASISDFYTQANGSLIIPSGTTAQRDSTPSVGMFRFNSDTGEAEIYDGSEWDSVGAVAFEQVIEETLTSGQTTVTPTGGLTDGAYAVYYNGVRLQASDYSLSGDGLTLTIAAADDTGDILTIVKRGTAFNSVDHYTKSEADANFAAASHNHDASDINAGTLDSDRLDTGTGANQIVQLDGSGALPAVDGSALTGIESGSSFTRLADGVSLGSGSSVSVTGIPSGTREIIVQVDNASQTLNASGIFVYLGDAGGIETNDYNGVWFNNSTTPIGSSAMGARLGPAGDAGNQHDAIMTLHSPDGLYWKMQSAGNASGGKYSASSGHKRLSAEITQLELRTGGGNFDNGTYTVDYR